MSDQVVVGSVKKSGRSAVRECIAVSNAVTRFRLHRAYMKKGLPDHSVQTFDFMELTVGFEPTTC